MKIKSTLRNHSVIPETREEWQDLRSGKWQVYQEDATESVYIDQQLTKFRSGLTFTPYANPTKCNAHCRFCSEELQRKHQRELTAQNIISNYEEYFQGLAAALKDLSPITNIGLSLSGLEATSDPIWLLHLLTVINEQNEIPRFNEKVLYTNSSGLYKHPDLVPALRDANFDRLEISRCHYDDAINQKIMYINRNEPIYQNEAYEKLIKKTVNQVHIKNSCILTQVGINSIAEIEKYLDWALSLGITQVVFRELSRLDETYLENNTKIWVEQNRVAIDPLLQAILPDLEQPRKHWDYQWSNVGYYYYNEYFTYKNKMEVILETSSYNELISRNESAIIQKLVFHSNGNLCGDWDPDSNVLANYFSKKEILA